MQNQEESEKQTCIQVLALVRRKGNFYKWHVWLSNSGKYIHGRQSTSIMCERTTAPNTRSPWDELMSALVWRSGQRMRVADLSVPPFPALGEGFCPQTPSRSVLPRRFFQNWEQQQEKWTGSPSRTKQKPSNPQCNQELEQTADMLNWFGAWFGRGAEQEGNSTFLAHSVQVPECFLGICMTAVAQQASPKKGSLPSVRFCSLSGRVHVTSQGTYLARLLFLNLSGYLAVQSSLTYQNFPLQEFPGDKWKAITGNRKTSHSGR